MVRAREPPQGPLPDTTIPARPVCRPVARIGACAVAYPHRLYGEVNMTLCPIAIVAGCRKCPAFTVCPVKSVIGDQVKEAPAAKSGSSGAKKSSRKGA